MSEIFKQKKIVGEAEMDSVRVSEKEREKKRTDNKASVVECVRSSLYYLAWRERFIASHTGRVGQRERERERKINFWESCVSRHIHSKEQARNQKQNT